MAILKFLIIGMGGLVVLGSSAIYLISKMEQDELNEDSGWEEFNTKWKNSIDNKRIKALDDELSKICNEENGNNCSTKEGILEATRKTPNLTSNFKSELDGFSGVGNGFNETCKEILKEFKHVKAFCPA